MLVASILGSMEFCSMTYPAAGHAVKGEVSASRFHESVSLDHIRAYECHDACSSSTYFEMSISSAFSLELTYT